MSLHACDVCVCFYLCVCLLILSYAQTVELSAQAQRNLCYCVYCDIIQHAC